MKLWNYIVMVTLLAILLELGGISSGFADIFKLIGLNLDNVGAACLKAGTCEVWDFSVSTFLGALFSTSGIFAILTAGTAIAGLLYRLPIEKITGLTFITGTVYLYIKIFGGIINYAANYSDWVTLISIGLIGSLGVGFAYSVFDWWTSGGD